MRYLPHTDADRRAMLDAIGVAGIEALFADVPPSKLRSDLPDLPRGRAKWRSNARFRPWRPVTFRPVPFPSSRAAALTSIIFRRRSIM